MYILVRVGHPWAWTGRSVYCESCSLYRNGSQLSHFDVYQTVWFSLSAHTTKFGQQQCWRLSCWFGENAFVLGINMLEICLILTIYYDSADRHYRDIDGKYIARFAHFQYSIVHWTVNTGFNYTLSHSFFLTRTFFLYYSSKYFTSFFLLLYNHRRWKLNLISIVWTNCRNVNMNVSANRVDKLWL